MAKLKVYRTPAGFYDAYVATTSQKAALEAWGSKADLFQRGIAEVVTDAALTAEPLAKPGEVIKRARTAADAEPEPPRRDKPSPPPPEKAVKATPKPKPKPTSKPKPKPKPRPNRAALDAAEQALADAEVRHAAARAELDREEAALAKRRRALIAQQEREAARLDAARNKTHAAYDRALSRWQG